MRRCRSGDRWLTTAGAVAALRGGGRWEGDAGGGTRLSISVRLSLSSASSRGRRWIVNGPDISDISFHRALVDGGLEKRAGGLA